MYFSIRVPSLSRNKLIQGKKNTQRENAEPVKIDFGCVWAHPGVRSRGPPALEEVLLRRPFLPSGSIKSPFENTFEIGGSCERLIKSRVIQISSHALARGKKRLNQGKLLIGQICCISNVVSLALAAFGTRGSQKFKVGNSCRNGSYQNGLIGTKNDIYARNCLDFERLSDGLRHVVYGYARS